MFVTCLRATLAVLLLGAVQGVDALADERAANVQDTALTDVAQERPEEVTLTARLLTGASASQHSREGTLLRSYVVPLPARTRRPAPLPESIHAGTPLPFCVTPRPPPASLRFC